VIDSGPAGSPGFLGAFRALGDSLLGSLQGRIELLAIELEEEKYRLIQILFWISAAVFSAAMGIIFGSLVLVYLFWESARLAVLAGLGVFYLAIFIATAIGFRRFLKRQPRPFAGTIDELEEDRACIRDEN